MKTFEPMLKATFVNARIVDVLKLEGDLAWDTVTLMKDVKKALADREGVPLAVDLSGLEFIDSKGISFLLQLRFLVEGKPVSLVSIPENIRKVLERTFVLNRFFVYKSVTEIEELATAAFAV